MPPTTIPSKVADLLRQMIDDAMATVGADAGRILLLDRPEGTLVQQVGRDFDARALEGVRHLGTGLDVWRSRVIERSDVMVIHDLSPVYGLTIPPEEQSPPPIYRSLIGIPISARGQTLGVLELAARRPGRFTGRETSSLKLAGREMGLLVELAREGWDSRHTADRLRILNDTMQAFLSCTLPEDILETLAQGAREIYPDSLCSTLVVEHSTGLLRTVFRASPEGTERTDEPSFRIMDAYDAILTRQETIVAPDLTTDAKTPHEERFLQEGMRTSVSIPIASGEHVLGIISLAHRQPVVYETADLGLLLMMTRQAAAALVSARIHTTLQQKAKKYRTLVEDAPEALLLVDVASGAIVESNRESRSITGYARDELIGKSFESLMPPESQPAIRDVLRSAQRNRELASVETRIQLKDGSLIECEVRLRILSLEDEGLAEAAVRDVSRERRLAKDMRRRLEDLTVLNSISETLARSGSLDHMLRSVLDNTLQLAGFETGGIFLIDSTTSREQLVSSAGTSPSFMRHSGFVDWGGAIGRYLGETAGALIVDELAKDQRFANSPLVEERYRCFLALPLRTPQESLGSLWMASRRPREVRGRTVSLLSHIVHHLASAICELHTVENLRRSEAENRLLLESIAQAIAIVRPDGSIVHVNSQLERLAGLPANEIIDHMNLRDLLGCQLLPRGLTAGEVPEGTGTPAPMHYEISVADSEGSERWLETTISPLPERRQYLVSILDITDRKHTQIALAKENEDLRYRLGDLERFNRFSIGRERRIQDLKQRIEELERMVSEQRKHASQGRQ